MESVRSEAVEALGLKLIEQLNLEPERDLLSGWLAHYVAELMEASAAAKPKDRDALQARCAEAILDLWAHRHELHPAIPAFADLRALERAILGLAPDGVSSRYFSPLQAVLSASQPSEETRQWLVVAENIDTSARELVRYCLRRAADGSLDEGEEWLEAGRAALGEDGPEQSLIRFLRSGEDGAVTEMEARVRWLRERATKLNVFVDLSKALADELTAGLAEAEIALTLEKAPVKPKAGASARPKPSSKPRKGPTV
nr:hypothetical protein [Brevundimonas diminuta]